MGLTERTADKTKVPQFRGTFFYGLADTGAADARTNTFALFSGSGRKPVNARSLLR
jgi:hypothetical protein